MEMTRFRRDVKYFYIAIEISKKNQYIEQY